MPHTWILNYFSSLLKCTIFIRLMPRSDVVIISMQPYRRITWSLIFFVLNQRWPGKNSRIPRFKRWLLPYSDRGSCHIHDVKKSQGWGGNASFARWLQNDRYPISWMRSSNGVIFWILRRFWSKKGKVDEQNKQCISFDVFEEEDPVRLKVHLIQPFAEHGTHAASYSYPPFPRWFLEPLSWRGTHVASYSFPLSCVVLRCKLLIWWCLYMVFYIYLVAICVYAFT